MDISPAGLHSCSSKFEKFKLKLFLISPRRDGHESHLQRTTHLLIYHGPGLSSRIFLLHPWCAWPFLRTLSYDLNTANTKSTKLLPIQTSAPPRRCPQYEICHLSDNECHYGVPNGSGWNTSDGRSTLRRWILLTRIKGKLTPLRFIQGRSSFNVYTSLALNHVVCRPIVLEVCNVEETTATLSTWPNPEAYYWQFLWPSN